VLLHAAHRLGDEKTKVRCLKAANNSDVADQLSVAALKFADQDYHDAIYIFKDLVMKNRSSVMTDSRPQICLPDWCPSCAV